jgi:hypothetical protein
VAFTYHGLSNSRAGEIDHVTKYASFILIAFVFCCSTAAAQPSLIRHLGTAPQDPARTYAIVKDYLSDPQKGLDTLEDGTVTLTVKIGPGGGNFSNVNVTADF